MTNRKPFADLASKVNVDPARRARVEQQKRAIHDALALAEWRGARGLSEHEVPDGSRSRPGNVSRLAHEEDAYVSTLRAHVAELGGTLEINVIFPDQRVVLVAAEETTPAVDDAHPSEVGALAGRPRGD